MGSEVCIRDSAKTVPEEIKALVSEGPPWYRGVVGAPKKSGESKKKVNHFSKPGASAAALSTRYVGAGSNSGPISLQAVPYKHLTLPTSHPVWILFRDGYLKHTTSIECA